MRRFRLRVGVAVGCLGLVAAGGAPAASAAGSETSEEISLKQLQDVIAEPGVEQALILDDGREFAVPPPGWSVAAQAQVIESTAPVEDVLIPLKKGISRQSLETKSLVIPSQSEKCGSYRKCALQILHRVSKVSCQQTLLRRQPRR